MADTAPKTLYRDEWIRGFERRVSHFRATSTTDALVDGLTAVFLVATSGGRSASTRGPNGLIPSSVSDYVRPQVTLVEEHDKERLTQFKQVTSQSDLRAIAQEESLGTIMRAIDARIIAALDTGTITAGTAGTSVMEKGIVSTALTTLLNADVPHDGQIFCAITPNQWAHLEDYEAFSSADFVDQKPYVLGAPDPQADSVQMRRWMGVNWFVSNALPGAGTSSATCYMYHRKAIGYAYNQATVDAAMGYDEEDDYYFVRHTVYHGATKLQNTGIVKIGVKDDAYIAS